MRKIKVLFFSNQYSMGGGEHTFQLAIKYIDKNKFDVTAAGWRGGPRLEKIKEIGVETFIEPDQHKMIEWMKTKNFDIVYDLRMGITESILIDTFTAANVPIIIEHNCFGQFDSSKDRLKINRHIVPSKVTVKIYNQRAGSFFDPEKITQIYPAIDAEVFKDNKFERDWSVPIFGKHARKDWSKWHPINFKILPLIREIVPEAKFYTIGLPDEFRSLIKELNVEDMIVEFENNTDDKEVLNFLNKITVFTHANRYGESFGNSISEAMASGLPVITHTGGDSAQCELITHGFNGLISSLNLYGGMKMEANETETLNYANNLILLLKNPELKKSFGEAGRQRCFDWFDGELVTKKLEDVFMEEFNKINKEITLVSTEFKWRDVWTPEDYIKHVQTSINNGLARKSKCDNFPFTIQGMSTPEFRSFLNNLCSVEDAYYLEIGPWIGGTICAAVQNNTSLTSYVVDNFSYFPDHDKIPDPVKHPWSSPEIIKKNLIYNISQVEKTTKDITLADGDCFTMNSDFIDHKIDFYFYDASHTRESQKKALTHFLDKMNDTFVWIVDDYNEQDVKDGTNDALEELKDKITIHKEWIYLTPGGFSENWHNGCYIAVISKK